MPGTPNDRQRPDFGLFRRHGRRNSEMGVGDRERRNPRHKCLGYRKSKGRLFLPPPLQSLQAAPVDVRF